MTGNVRLIVNADDFGIAEAVNRGVVEAFDRGIVTSTSIMATGDAFDHAVELARSRPSLAVGVHLVLTEHRPLVAGRKAATFTGPDGKFHAHTVALARRQLRGALDLDAVREELDAQIRHVQAAGLFIGHLDGHQHVHALPGIARVVAELAAAHGIRAVRYPAERMRAYMLRRVGGARRLLEQLALRLACAWSPLKPLRRSDDFVGFYFGGRLDEGHLATLLAALPTEGTVELMCHPGHADRVGGEDWHYAWAAECAALTSPRIRDLLEAHDVRLVASKAS